LTAEGQALAARLAPAFTEIEAALAATGVAAMATRLRVSALPMLTSVWLIPRLQRFQAQHPGVAIEVETGNRLVDLAREGVDVAIRNLPAPQAGLVCRKLLDLRAVPLCSPAMAAALHGPADLAGVALIHISSRPDGWAAWLAAVGQPGLVPRGNLSFDSVTAVLEAAAEGAGVALGLDPLVWQASAARRLVMPFAVPPVSAGCYFAVHRPEDRSRPLVRAFVAWLAAEMAADAPRLARQSAAQGMR
jgi:LysR family glycine cleavage system transcriptional activator